MITTLFKGITYDDTTNTISGSLNDFILMNETNPGTTTNIKGASFAIKMYLLKRGSNQIKYWGATRLDYIIKNVYKIKTNPVFILII
jgi:hypothetical protein